jgi:hypothetical protein
LTFAAGPLLAVAVEIDVHFDYDPPQPPEFDGFYDTPA